MVGRSVLVIKEFMFRVQRFEIIHWAFLYYSPRARNSVSHFMIFLDAEYLVSNSFQTMQLLKRNVA